MLVNASAPNRGVLLLDPGSITSGPLVALTAFEPARLLALEPRDDGLPFRIVARIFIQHIRRKRAGDLVGGNRYVEAHRLNARPTGLPPPAQKVRARRGERPRVVEWHRRRASSPVSASQAG